MLYNSRGIQPILGSIAHPACTNQLATGSSDWSLKTARTSSSRTNAPRSTYRFGGTVKSFLVVSSGYVNSLLLKSIEHGHWNSEFCSFAMKNGDFPWLCKCFPEGSQSFEHRKTQKIIIVHVRQCQKLYSGNDFNIPAMFTWWLVDGDWLALFYPY